MAAKPGPKSDLMPAVPRFHSKSGKRRGWHFISNPRPRADTSENHPGGLSLSLSPNQRRILNVAIILALVTGAWLVGDFFVTIVLALVAAYLFMPLYRYLRSRIRRAGLAAGVTLILATLLLFIPLAAAVVITIGQVEQLLEQLARSSNGSISLDGVSDSLLQTINHLLGSVTQGSLQLSADQVRDTMTKLAQGVASITLGILAGSFSGIAGLVTQAIIFIALFVAITTHAHELVAAVRIMNPLGNQVSSLYLTRLGVMTKGIVRGQFIIAVCQGIAGAVFLYIAGVHYFFFMAMILSFLNLIPLGGGILSIPIGIVLILFGNIWQGVFVIATHLLIVTNIDNVLRPRLVPRSAHLNPALMLLAVFGGLGIFGFPGLIVGPIIMVLVVSTIELYLAINRSKVLVPADTSVG